MSIALWWVRRDLRLRDNLVQGAAGCVIGRDYTAPIVDHAMARERTLTAYRQAQSHARD